VRCAMRCSNCGGDVSDGVTICPYCLEALPGQTKPPTPPSSARSPEPIPEACTNACPLCAQPRRPWANFCTGCGAPLGPRQVAYTVVVDWTEADHRRRQRALARALTGIPAVVAARVSRAGPGPVGVVMPRTLAEQLAARMAYAGVAARVTPAEEAHRQFPQAFVWGVQALPSGNAAPARNAARSPGCLLAGMALLGWGR